MLFSKPFTRFEISSIYVTFALFRFYWIELLNHVLEKNESSVERLSGKTREENSITKALLQFFILIPRYNIEMISFSAVAYVACIVNFVLHFLVFNDIHLQGFKGIDISVEYSIDFRSIVLGLLDRALSRLIVG